MIKKIPFNPRTICHPATAVLLWLFFMVWIMHVGESVLSAMSVLILLGFTKNARQQFMRYIRRSRWLLLVLLLMHAYSIPGAALWPMLGIYSPSQVGMYSGLLQSWRLLLMLAILAVLMTRLSREALLLGMYTVLTPLSYIGLPAERIAVRIWLTMHYAEALLHESPKKSFTQRLQQLSGPPPMLPEAMQALILPVYRAGWLDYVCLIIVMMLAVWVR